MAQDEAGQLPAEVPTGLGAPPRIDDLLALSRRAWREVVAHARRVLADLPADQLTPPLRRVRSTPANKLLQGRSRRDLAEALAEGGVAWVGLRDRLGRIEHDDELAFLLDDGAPRPSASPEPAEGAGRDGDAEALRADVARLRERLRSSRGERDEARRRAEGALARLDAAEQQLADSRATIADLERRVTELAAGLDQAGRDQERAVERERRRQDAVVADLQRQLAELRRAEEDRRRARHDRERRDAVEAERDAARRAEEREAQRVRRSGGSDLAAPGRPSELPPGAAPGSTAHAKALLGPGRRVLVDGYNVAKTVRSDLADEGAERQWLEAGLQHLVASRHVEVEVFWDGDRTQGTSVKVGGIKAHFSPRGVTADDDIEFAVAAAPDDEPIVVVTDDRGLRERLAPYRVDLLGTQPFGWALRG